MSSVDSVDGFVSEVGANSRTSNAEVVKSRHAFVQWFAVDSPGVAIVVVDGCELRPLVAAADSCAFLCC